MRRHRRQIPQPYMIGKKMECNQEQSLFRLHRLRQQKLSYQKLNLILYLHNQH
jgi:hypothetical protein